MGARAYVARCTWVDSLRAWCGTQRLACLRSAGLWWDESARGFAIGAAETLAGIT
jgi:hypothetical protein